MKGKTLLFVGFCCTKLLYPLDGDPVSASFLCLAVLLQIEWTILQVYLVESIILLLLLFSSALISGSEVAFFSLTQKELETCRDSPKVTDKAILRLLDNQKMLLATILLLNNLVNVAIVVISTYMMWQVAGKDNQGWIVLFVTMFVTAAIVFFGEVIPKVVARQRALPFARKMSRPMLFLASRLRPSARLLAFLGDYLERRLKKNKQRARISVEDLNQALEITTQDETSDEARNILKGVINFGQITAKQIMTSRMDMTAASLKTPYLDILRLIRESGYSRIPIYEDTLDNIVGILYAKDLLLHLENDNSFDWTKLIRPKPLRIPEYKKINEVFKQFQSTHIHLGIVVDEYGGTSGLVTLEDVIEEIVGDINDEFDDEEEKLFNRINETNYLFEAKIPLNDFCRVIGLDLSLIESVRGESETLGGLLLELFEKMPTKGEQVSLPPLHFVVESVDKTRIRRVRVRIEHQKAEKYQNQDAE